MKVRVRVRLFPISNYPGGCSIYAEHPTQTCVRCESNKTSHQHLTDSLSPLTVVFVEFFVVI